MVFNAAAIDAAMKEWRWSAYKIVREASYYAKMEMPQKSKDKKNVGMDGQWAKRS